MQLVADDEDEMEGVAPPPFRSPCRKEGIKGFGCRNKMQKPEQQAKTNRARRLRAGGRGRKGGGRGAAAESADRQVRAHAALAAGERPPRPGLVLVNDTSFLIKSEERAGRRFRLCFG